MNSQTVVVFDDWIYGTASVYTAEGFNEILSSCNSLTIQANASQASGTSPTITVTKETACDERDFVTATTLISAQPLAASTMNVFVGSGSDFAARSTRLNIALGGTSPVAHVQVLATLRTELG